VKKDGLRRQPIAAGQRELLRIEPCQMVGAPAH
jgi:hypothetical protein